MTTEEARDHLDAAMASGEFDAAFGDALVAAVGAGWSPERAARFATMHGLAAMYHPKTIAMVRARRSRAPTIGAASNIVKADRIITDEIQTWSGAAVNHTHSDDHTVRYNIRIVRGVRFFQPKLGAEIIPTWFGTIKGARAAARRKWGRAC